MKREIASIPTWAVVRMLYPFLPKSHPWHGRRFTLREWWEGQTDVCRMFDGLFWIHLAVSGAMSIWRAK